MRNLLNLDVLLHPSKLFPTTFLLLLFGLFLPLCLQGQNCTTVNITLSTQADVDNFQANHGPCTTVTGDLEIMGVGITNLTGLSGVTSIGGRLNIQANPNLTNIDGLSNLTNVVGDLFIIDMSTLMNVDGLSGLSSVGGILAFNINPSLANIDGLSSLTSVGDLFVQNSPLLTNIDGLSNLSGNVGSVSFLTNASLTNINGLSGLSNVGGNVLFINNNSLLNLHGLSNLNNIGGLLSIFSNDVLDMCCGVFSLLEGVKIGGAIDIKNNGITGDCNSVADINAACATPPVPPIPTMSQWGLLIFGLLVLNLGLGLIRLQRFKEVLS